MNNFDLKEFYHKGYSFIGNIIKKEGLQLLRNELDNLEEKKCKTNYSKLLFQEDPGTGSIEDLKNFKKSARVMSPEYRKIIGMEHITLFKSILSFRVFKDIAEEIYGGIETKPFNYCVCNKPPKMGLKIPWHQNIYPNVDKPSIMRIVIAIDGMTKRRGCIQIIPNSHSLGRLSEDGTITDDQLNNVLKKLNVDNINPIHLEMEAGDVVVINNLCLHSSSVNTTGKPNRYLSICYVDYSAKIKK